MKNSLPKTCGKTIKQTYQNKALLKCNSKAKVSLLAEKWKVSIEFAFKKQQWYSNRVWTSLHKKWKYRCRSCGFHMEIHCILRNVFLCCSFVVILWRLCYFCFNGKSSSNRSSANVRLLSRTKGEEGKKTTDIDTDLICLHKLWRHSDTWYLISVWWGKAC